VSLGWSSSATGIATVSDENAYERMGVICEHPHHLVLEVDAAGDHGAHQVGLVVCETVYHLGGKRTAGDHFANRCTGIFRKSQSYRFRSVEVSSDTSTNDP